MNYDDDEEAFESLLIKSVPPESITHILIAGSFRSGPRKVSEKREPRKDRVPWTYSRNIPSWFWIVKNLARGSGMGGKVGING